MASQGQRLCLASMEGNQAGPWEKWVVWCGGEKAGGRGESNGESQEIKIKKDTGAS